MLRILIVVAALFSLSGCFKTRQEIAQEKEEAEVRSNLQQNIVDYNQGLEKTQADLGRLQGRIEELEHNHKKEISGLTSGRDSEQKTLDELKARLNSLQEGQNTLFEEIKKLKEDSLAAASERARPVAAPPVSKKKGANFEAAVTAYKAKDYPTAVSYFRAFLEASPKSKRALDAHYFLGDSLYKQKEYEQAVVEFGAVQEKAPDSALGRRATLRLAQCFKAMNKTKDAKAFAQILIQGAPNSDEAKAARKLLR